MNTNFVFMGFLVAFITLVSIEDIRHKRIPNMLLLICGFTGVLLKLSSGHLNVSDSLLGGLIGGGVFLAISLITGKMGGGDIKFITVLGILLGTNDLIPIIFTSFLVSLPILVYLLIRKRITLKDSIAFGPMISIATCLQLLF